ncbi:MAG TPA: metal-sensing transcriptional repressor [Candidatus Paceibacterota bacterium]|nr:metal-sensing transcriptional repressor [Candidatus Paceibacterota bacterium]
MHESRKKIIDHISRLEGQLASVKSELGREDPDCARASATLQSAARSFAGLREQFVETFLRTHILSTRGVKDESLFSALLGLIKS